MLEIAATVSWSKETMLGKNEDIKLLKFFGCPHLHFRMAKMQLMVFTQNVVASLA